MGIFIYLYVSIRIYSISTQCTSINYVNTRKYAKRPIPKMNSLNFGIYMLISNEMTY